MYENNFLPNSFIKMHCNMAKLILTCIPSISLMIPIHFVHCTIWFDSFTLSMTILLFYYFFTRLSIMNFFFIFSMLSSIPRPITKTPLNQHALLKAYTKVYITLNHTKHNLYFNKSIHVLCSAQHDPYNSAFNEYISTFRLHSFKWGPIHN